MKIASPVIDLSWQRVSVFLWAVLVLFMTRQFPLSLISIVGNVALFALFVVQLSHMRRSDIKNILLITAFIVVLLGYGLAQGNQLSWVVRFALVIFFVLSAYFMEISAKAALKWLVIFTTIQCLFLIVFELLLMFVFSATMQMLIRQFFLSTMWGDVYSYDGFFFKVQVQGSALLPFVYCLSWVVDVFNAKRKWLMRGLFLVSIIIAGNFAFLLGIVAFHAVWFLMSIKTRIQLSNRIIVGVLAIFVFSVPVYQFVKSTMERKADISSAIRIEQTQALLSDMQESPKSFIFGQGLGNSVDVVGDFRDYREQQYYELQVLYIINQMGLLGFAVFLLLNVVFTMKKMNHLPIAVVYLCYVLYASINPYIVDTTQVVVIIALTASNKLITNEDHSLHTGAA